MEEFQIIERRDAQHAIEEATSTGELELNKDKIVRIRNMIGRGSRCNLSDTFLRAFLALRPFPSSQSQWLSGGLCLLFKNFVRKGKSHVETAFELLLKRLHENHAQIRLLAFKLILYTANHSKVAKSLLEENISEIITYSLGSDDSELPLPKSFARILRKTAVERLTEFSNDNPEMLRLARFIRNMNDKIVPNLRPIEETEYELHLIEKAGLEVAEALRSGSTGQESLQRSNSVQEINNGEGSQNLSRSGGLLPSESILNASNVNRLTLEQFLERIEDKILRLESRAEEKFASIDDLLREEGDRMLSKNDAGGSFDVAALNDMEEDDFNDFDFIDAEFDYDAVNNNNNGSTVPIKEEPTHEPAPVNLGRQEEREEAISRILEEMIDEILVQADLLINVVTRRTSVERDVREFHLSRLFSIRNRIKEAEARVHSLGYSRVSEVKLEEAIKEEILKQEDEKGVRINFSDHPVKNEFGKREREPDKPSRGLQFEKKRPRLIKLDSLEAPRTVNDVVEEKARAIRNAAIKRNKTKRPDKLFGKSIDAKRGDFRNIYDQ